MTEEERQRQMDFLLEHHAKSERRVERLERVLLMAIRAGDRQRRDVRERHTALVDAQIKTEDELRQLAEAQKHTDRRLSALIDIVIQGRDPNGNGKS